MMLKELRKRKKLTQVECADYLGMPVRTYQNYEADINRRDSLKYKYMLEKLEQYGYVDEEHGVLTVRKIRDICENIFPAYDVDYCYLFGSYAKGNATETSDVDLLLSTTVSGMNYYELVETLREGFNKKTDVLNLGQLTNNPELINEILKDGIKIYG